MTEAVASGHLSIGEVLALVQADFPDVTISKIRFLESQGLIAPERTASGYRKFYDSDIDRLRWILSQQRDHFLPLKVIKRMLDQGVDVADPSQVQPSLFSSPDDASEGIEQGSQRGSGANGPSTGGSGPGGPPRDSTPRSPAHPTVKSSAASSGSGGSLTTSDSDEHSGGAERPEKADSAGVDSAVADSAVADSAVADAAGARSAENPTRRHTTPADVVAALQEDPRVAKSQKRPVEAPADPTPPLAASRSGALGRGADGEPMAKDGLLATYGITDELLADLESFGLIRSVMRGGTPTYDAESQLVVRAAARYQELGVEPRHLRMYKVAAEREAGFVEQLVMPLLKQRNPASREQAAERTDELLALGAELHASLLRRQIGPVLGA